MSPNVTLIPGNAPQHKNVSKELRFAINGTTVVTTPMTPRRIVTILQMKITVLNPVSDF